MEKTYDQTASTFKDLTGLKPTPEALRSVPRDMVLRHRIVPVHAGKEGVSIALSNLADSAALDDIRFFIGQDVKLILADKDAIELLIRSHYSDGIDLNTGIQQAATYNPQLRGHDLAYNEDIIVEMVNTVISNAIRMNASDVHIEPFETRLRIRYRLDGFCYEINSFPNELKPPITSRAKVMAGMDLAEKRLPQDGRIITRIDGKDVDIRVSTLPVVHGESVVFRILDRSTIHKGLKTLGLLEEDHERVTSIAAAPDGMVIVAGPTGSGKTTTLYTILHELIKPTIKIITIEDPVEYTIEGINQIQIQSGDGRNFRDVLRHILRHDPDVIMVGEMRDLESAEIAMRSSLTGHKVLSTLHTNDAPSVITRFINMGLPPFMINASVHAAIYQRLVRTLCPQCKVRGVPTKAESLLISHIPAFDQFLVGQASLPVINGNEIKWFRPGGCKECNFSGYKGRTAIFEIMLIDDEIKRLTMKRSPSMAIRRAALANGMRDIRIDGMMKVMKGITTVSEVLRVT